MKSIQTHINYIEWLSAEQMHEASKDWLSELQFVSDEHLFFEDLITTFTSRIIATKKISDTKEIIDILYASQKQNKTLIKAIKTHEAGLKIMLDGINQIKEEKAYRKGHKELIEKINTFLKDYKSLKSQLFDIIKKIKKEEKRARLIDRR